MTSSVLLGFEVGTGERVEIPIGHMVVTGATQAAGKTTTLSALIQRSGLKAIAFITKRGEGGFSDTSAHRIPPYFRQQADWVFVSGLIDATLSEKNKLLRSWLMKVCRGTKTLAEVQANVKKAQKTARGFSESIYTEIDGYLDLVVPEIENLPPAHKISLENGLNIMDLSAYSTAVQALVIRSVVQHVYEHENGVITVIPEAWEVLPEGRGSPAKAAIEALVRKGGGLGNFIWVDSQDLAGVWKLAVRAAKVYLIGVQREANEIKRTLANIPDSVAKPKAKDVAMLELGQFYACWGKHVQRVYVQPSWMESEVAQNISMGQAEFDDYLKPIPDPEFRPVGIDATGRDWSGELTKFYSGTDNANGDTVNDEFLREVIERQTTILEKLADQVLVVAKRQTVSVSSGNGVSIGNGMPDKDYNIIPKTNIPVNMEDALYETFRSRILKDSAVLMKLSHMAPEIEIDIERPVINLGGNDLRSWLAILLSEGFFDKGANGNVAFKELKRRGKAVAVPNVYTMLDRFAAEGFVTIERSGKNKTYLKNPDLKITRRDK